MTVPTSSGMAALSQAEDRFKRAELLIDIGTQALRLRFDEWRPPTTLQEKLQEAEHIIKRIASCQQIKTLYPKYGK